jgi:hypothetical protein
VVLAGLIVNVRALETCWSGLRTVTAADPVAAMSVAAMLAVTRVALPNVVVRGAPFHSTVAPETKFVPSTVSVNAAPPAVALLGVSAVIVGADAAGAVIVNGRATDSPPPGLGVNTVTEAVPAAVISPAPTVACSWEPPTYVVARSAPLHLTTELVTKPLPVTVRVKAGLPAATLLGVKVVTAGTGGTGAIVNDRAAADSPPPGLGVNTVTEAVPAAAISPAPMVACSCVPLTYVVARSARSISRPSSSRTRFLLPEG